MFVHIIGCTSVCLSNLRLVVWSGMSVSISNCGWLWCIVFNTIGGFCYPYTPLAWFCCIECACSVSLELCYNRTQLLARGWGLRDIRLSHAELHSSQAPVLGWALPCNGFHLLFVVVQHIRGSGPCTFTKLPLSLSGVRDMKEVVFPPSSYC